MIEKLYHYSLSITRIIDGDTLVGDIDMGFDMIMKRQRIRLVGINTPEIRGLESEEGIKVKSRVIDLLTDAPTIIRTLKRDSFGRVLAGVYYQKDDEWINLNQQLLDEGLAEVYDK